MKQPHARLPLRGRAIALYRIIQPHLETFVTRMETWRGDAWRCPAPGALKRSLPSPGEKIAAAVCPTRLTGAHDLRTATARCARFHHDREQVRYRVRITDAAFAAARSSAGVFAASEFQLRLAHTTRSSLAATFADNFTSPPIVIHHGPRQYAPAEGARRDLGFRGSFAYDGQRSLVLEIRYRGRTSGCTYLQGVNSIPRAWAEPCLRTV